MNSVLNEVERYAELAHTKLEQRDNENAIHYFKLALHRAKASSHDTLIQKAAVNLGAALVAVRRAQKAKKILSLTAKSPPNDNIVAGDLFYNLGLSLEQLGNIPEARENFQKSFNYYSTEPECGLSQAGIACKIAALSIHLFDNKKAADAFKQAASLYKLGGLSEQQALCQYRRALVLEACGSDIEAFAAAGECEHTCGDVALDPNIGRLYNELGLFYTKHNHFDRAMKCFGQALSVIRMVVKDKKFEAIVLQNCGAIHSCQSEFKKSIALNKEASALHAKTNSRHGQGQCFLNIAFAYSQLKDLDLAGEYYLHALQANRDTNDRKGEWQALEGLSTIAYYQRRYDRCRDYLSQAIIAASVDQNAADLGSSSKAVPACSGVEVVRQRLLNKLAQVLQLTSKVNDTIVLEKLSAPSKRQSQESSHESEADEDDTDHRIADKKKSNGKKSRLAARQSQADVENREEIPSRLDVTPRRPEGSSDGESGPDAEAERRLKDYQAMCAKQDGDQEEEEDNEEEEDDDDDEDEDDDSEDSESDSDSDSDGSYATQGPSGSLPQYSAPRPPRFNNTYIRPVDGNSTGILSNAESIRDPTYMSVTARRPTSTSKAGESSTRSHKPDEPQRGRIDSNMPPPLPPRPQDQGQGQSASRVNTDLAEDSDDVKLPTRSTAATPARRASQACHIM